MKKRLQVFGLYVLFWMILFFAGRLFFLLYQYNFSFNIPFKEWFLSFIYGSRLDISTTGYIMAVIGLLFLFTAFFNGNIIHKVMKPFTFIFLLACSLIIIADLELYRNWGYRMDSTPLLYLTKPKEAVASTDLWLIFVLLFGIAAMVWAGMFFYRKVLQQRILLIKKTNIFSLFFLLLLTGSMILPIRASLGIAPVNTGMVYFSKHTFSNHAAVNVVWNVMNSVVYRKDQEKTYDFMESIVAEKIANEIHISQGETKQVIQKQKPNVVIILLESFTSKVIGVLNDKWDATPKLNELTKEGLLFTNFYANGSRSDKGIVAVLSGYPAQPTTSVIKTPSKTESLPSLFKSFNAHGYNSCFYYGGDINFANMHSYFLNSGVQHIVSDKNFDPEQVNSKWGAHDEHLFHYLYRDLLNEKEPYLKVAFTLSSHDPYDVPKESVFKGSDYDSRFLNSVYYTDSCLGAFFEKVKKEDEIWNNTLFVLVADHGSNRPGDSPNYATEKFKIPMLWLGGVIGDSLKTCNKLASQIDIPSTLLNQLKINADYPYSKDIFKQENKGFVYYAFNDGFGFLTDTTSVIFDNISNTAIYTDGKYEQDLEKGKAYLQSLMDNYQEL